MTEKIDVSFTKDEWRVLSALIKKQLRDLRLGDSNEERQKLQAKINSYQRQLDQLDMDVSENKNFITIADKMELD